MWLAGFFFFFFFHFILFTYLFLILFIFKIFRMVENCFTMQMHVAKGRMGQHQGPQCMNLHFGQKDSGLGDSVIRFPCVWNQGHERWGNGAGLEELASALESDMRDSAATSHSRISSPMTTSWPCSHPLCVRVCVHTCVCVCVICISLISLEPSNYFLTRFPSFSFNCISIFKEPSTVATLHFITSLSKCLALIRP